MKNFVLILIVACVVSPVCAAAGFIVAAPDRGFSGNEVLREAVAQLDGRHDLELVFVTGKQTGERLTSARERLEAENDQIVLLPFYLTQSHPDMELLGSWLEESEAAMGRPFGRSYLVLSALEQQLRRVDDRGSTQLVLLGHGASNERQANAMEVELEQILETAARGLQFSALDAVVWPDAGNMDQAAYERHLATLKQQQTVVLPFHLGADLDAMMGFTPRIQAAAPSDLTVLDGGISAQTIARWLQREAVRYSNLGPDDVGVVVHAHGSDWHWNETMRQGSAPLGDQYKLAFAFSMGDAATLADAIAELEQQGAKAAVIIRVFGMATSFRDGIVRFIGQAWEDCEASAADSHHGHGMAMTPPVRLQSNLPVVSVGGLENHPLYAKALYQRALTVSEAPSKETIILVAHGLGSEAGNAHWREVLESIRRQMLELGATRFRAIEIALWSEDWPKLRQTAVEHVRSLVQEANEDNGRAIVIPARTLGQGHADEYLEGLDYVLGEGFAPHPLFAQWLSAQAELGINKLTYEPPADWRCEFQ